MNRSKIAQPTTRSVAKMLEIRAEWSDNKIAKHCGVSDRFVGKVRSVTPNRSELEPTTRTYTTKHGTEAKMVSQQAAGKARG